MEGAVVENSSGGGVELHKIRSGWRAIALSPMSSFTLKDPFQPNDPFHHRNLNSHYKFKFLENLLALARVLDMKKKCIKLV